MSKLFNFKAPFLGEGEAAPIPEMENGPEDIAQGEAGPEGSADMTSPALQQMLTKECFYGLAKRYAEWLLNTGIADSKETCMEMVSKFVDAAINRGDATAYEMTRIVDYIRGDELKVKTPWQEHYAFINQITEDVTTWFTWFDDQMISGFSEKEQQLARAFREASRTFYEARRALMDAVNKGMFDTIDSIVVGYASVLDPKFVEIFKK